MLVLDHPTLGGLFCGRELFSQGLLQKVGNGENTRVWIDNWLLDVVPRTPMYNQDAIVDLTLSIRDLIIVN